MYTPTCNTPPAGCYQQDGGCGTDGACAYEHKCPASGAGACEEKVKGTCGANGCLVRFQTICGCCKALLRAVLFLHCSYHRLCGDRILLRQAIAFLRRTTATPSTATPVSTSASHAASVRPTIVKPPRLSNVSAGQLTS